MKRCARRIDNYGNLCRILKEMQRTDPAQGIGKPEQLKRNLRGLWSRRLSQRDRIVVVSF